MRSLLILFVAAIIVIVSSCSQKVPNGFVLVKGGTFVNKKSNYHGKSVTITNFYMGRYEVSQKDWIEVIESNPSVFKGDNLPVETVSWYDCVEYCNRRSIKERLKPYYTINKNKIDPYNTNEFDDVKWTITLNENANGYRLPNEAEWEYAADGGLLSKNYTYSGSNNINEVAWYWRNSGDTVLTGEWLWNNLEKNQCRTHPIASKKPNELGIYDMSGNVREWCWDWYDGDENTPKGRIWKGGGWIGADFCCEPFFRVGHQANGMGPDQGFRVCRSK